jgi:hypothetical protein
MLRFSFHVAPRQTAESIQQLEVKDEAGKPICRIGLVTEQPGERRSRWHRPRSTDRRMNFDPSTFGRCRHALLKNLPPYSQSKSWIRPMT